MVDLECHVNIVEQLWNKNIVSSITHFMHILCCFVRAIFYANNLTYFRISFLLTEAFFFSFFFLNNKGNGERDQGRSFPL
jgi:hypothetical protein